MELTDDKHMYWVILLLFILGLFAGSIQGSSRHGHSQETSLSPASLSPMIESESPSVGSLPSHTFHLYLSDPVIGITWINASIAMDVVKKFNSSTGDLIGYQHGFTIEPLDVLQPPLSPEILGIGVDEIRRYPYVYVNSIRSFDYWKEYEADYIMRRSWPFWTTTTRTGLWGGAVWPEQMEENVTIGQYLYLEGIRLYFDNDVTVDCSPKHLLLWAEFRWNSTDWTTSSGIWQTTRKDTFIDESDASLTVSFPVSWTNVTILCSVISVTIVLTIVYKKRERLAEILGDSSNRGPPLE